MIAVPGTALDMTWRPLTSTHAIERVRFTMKFREAIPGKLLRQLGEIVGRKRNEVRLDGPTPITSFNFGVQVMQDGQQVLSAPQASSHGWQFIRSSSGGAPLEIVAADGDKIVYETAEYRRWDTFKQRFNKIVAELISIAVGTLDVDFVALEYFDRFYFDGPKEQALPALLLPGIAKNLHPDAISGQTLWHLHRGWFEHSADGYLLINQNFDAQESVLPGRASPSRAVSILTKAEARSSHYPVETVGLAVLLDLLHDVTKNYFVEAVEPSILRAMGIK